jgi:hypothetical protein
MTYPLDPRMFVENGPTVTAEAAIARLRVALIYDAAKRRQAAAIPARKAA